MENYHATTEEINQCTYCGSLNLQQREKGPHLGLFCNDCGRWLGWIPRRRKNSFKLAADPKPNLNDDQPEQLSFQNVRPDGGCTCCAHLAELRHAVTGIERELTVILRALLYGTDERGEPK